MPRKRIIGTHAQWCTKHHKRYQHFEFRVIRFDNSGHSQSSLRIRRICRLCRANQQTMWRVNRDHTGTRNDDRPMEADIVRPRGTGNAIPDSVPTGRADCPGRPVSFLARRRLGGEAGQGVI